MESDFVYPLTSRAAETENSTGIGACQSGHFALHLPIRFLIAITLNFSVLVFQTA